MNVRAPYIRVVLQKLRIQNADSSQTLGRIGAIKLMSDGQTTSNKLLIL